MRLRKCHTQIVLDSLRRQSLSRLPSNRRKKQLCFLGYRCVAYRQLLTVVSATNTGLWFFINFMFTMTNFKSQNIFILFPDKNRLTNYRHRNYFVLFTDVTSFVLPTFGMSAPFFRLPTDLTVGYLSKMN